MSAPLVRTKDGAILGIDWRREQEIVPGLVPADVVMPGDTIYAQGCPVVVHTVGKKADNAIIQAESAGGAAFAIVRHREDMVKVVAVGAFDR